MSSSKRDMLAGAGIVLILLFVVGGIGACCEDSGTVRGYYIRTEGKEVPFIWIYDDRIKDFDSRVAVFGSHHEAADALDRLNSTLSKDTEAGP